MVLVYVVAAKGNDDNASPCAVKAEVYRDKNTIYKMEKMTDEPNIEKAYINGLIDVLDAIEVGDDEKIAMMTTSKIAAHGNTALLESSGYPHRALWKQVKKRLQRFEYLPVYEAYSCWGDTLLSEAQEFAAKHLNKNT